MVKCVARENHHHETLPGRLRSRPRVQPSLHSERGDLFLRLARFRAPSHFALRHVASESTNVVLQDLVLVLQLVVVGLDGVNAFGEGLQRGLEGFGLPVHPILVSHSTEMGGVCRLPRSNTHS